MSELSIHELEAQHGEVLPEREALGVHGGGFSVTKNVTVTHINASNHSSVTQSGGYYQTASSSASQTITVNN
jgi:hypothetical protein